MRDLTGYARTMTAKAVSVDSSVVNTSSGKERGALRLGRDRPQDMTDA